MLKHNALAILILIAVILFTVPVLADSSITLDQETYILYVGENTTAVTEIITASSKAPKVEWTTSDKSVAKVSSSGKITAVSGGTATITVSLKKDPSVTASADVEVRVHAQSLAASEKKITLLADGSESQSTAQIGYTVKPANAYCQTVRWESSDESVVTVDENGLVRAVGVGSAEITGTSDDPSCKDTTTVTVQVGLLASSLTLSKTHSVLAVGKTLKLTPTRWPENKSGAKYKWTSSDTGVAKVSGKGVVTGVAPGEAVITCTASDKSGYSATCTVTVNAPLKTLTLSKRKVVLAPDTTWQMKVKLAPENATDPTIVWKSSREEIASVTQDGLITGLTPGTCKITASSVDGSGLAASVIITVKTYDLVIRDLGGADIESEANIYQGAQYFNLRSRYHKVKVQANGKRTDLDWSKVDLLSFNPESPHLTPIAQGEDVIMVDVHDLSDYFIHRSAKRWFTVYVTQTALDTQAP